jgi:hypothetical protein
MQRSLLSATRLFALLAILVGGLVALQPSSASAAPLYKYTATAGGTQIRALGTTIRSDLTSVSSLDGFAFPAANANTLANVGVPGLLNVGAVQTSAEATSAAGTDQIVGTANTGAINLLDGAITADAVETTATATQTGTTFAGGSDSDLVNLTIGGTQIPLSVGHNFKIGIPGVALVTLNEQVINTGSAGIQVTGSAIKIELLTGIAGAPIGTTIVVNPVTVGFALVDPLSVTPVSGFAYGTKISASVLGVVNLNSGTTALTTVPLGGTGGRTITNATAAADLPGILSLGAIESTSMATSVPVTGDVLNTHNTGRVNVLNGLVTATAIKVSARATKPAVGATVKTASSQVLDLKVLGIPVKLSAAPNSRFSVLGIVTVTINEQVTTANGITVVGLHVVGGPLLGSLAGVDVQVAVASSSVG